MWLQVVDVSSSMGYGGNVLRRPALNCKITVASRMVSVWSPSASPGHGNTATKPAHHCRINVASTGSTKPLQFASPTRRSENTIGVLVGGDGGVHVGTGVHVGAGVHVGTGVHPETGVPVAGPPGVAVGGPPGVTVATAVGVAVGSDVCVGVGVSVGMGVSVGIGVSVGVEVGGGVAVGAGVGQDAPPVIVTLPCCLLTVNATPRSLLMLATFNRRGLLPKQELLRRTVASRPLPVGPSGGGWPMVLQPNLTLCGATVGPMQVIPRPVLPKNGPLVTVA